MKKNGYFSSGEFARMAHTTLRAIRYYDKLNILKPSFVSESGARFYTDSDFARLQQILLLKFLGFSLEDIREMTTGDADYHFMLDSLNIQLKLVRDRIEQMQLVERAIQDTAEVIRREHTVDWSRMLDLIHLTGMEKSLKNQYQDASNISSRIHLHALYAQNPQGWFPWVFEQCDLPELTDAGQTVCSSEKPMAENGRITKKAGFRVLELGCGDGALWTENRARIPQNVSIVLSDLSDGMLRDTRRNIGTADGRFSFEVFDCHQIPFEAESFDLVIANHVLFYCEDVSKVCAEVYRVLKPGGRFLCSTYGEAHMREVSGLVQEFDDRIVLSADRLFERFGKENGKRILESYFAQIQWRDYEDSLLVTDPEPLISYVLSCHGNQNQYLLNAYQEFRNYVRKKTARGFRITKEAGVFVCRKTII